MNTEKKDRFAVIDSISDGVGTLLVGEDERKIIVGLDLLPGGAKEGDWLEITDKGNFLAAPEVTEKRKKVMKSKLDMLRNR